MTIDIENIGKITANTATLNSLSIALREAADAPINQFSIYSKIYKEAADQIYDALDAKGVYDAYK